MEIIVTYNPNLVIGADLSKPASIAVVMGTLVSSPLLLRSSYRMDWHWNLNNFNDPSTKSSIAFVHDYVPAKLTFQSASAIVCVVVLNIII